MRTIDFSKPDTWWGGPLLEVWLELADRDLCTLSDQESLAFLKALGTSDPFEYNDIRIDTHEREDINWVSHNWPNYKNTVLVVWQLEECGSVGVKMLPCVDGLSRCAIAAVPPIHVAAVCEEMPWSGENWVTPNVVALYEAIVTGIRRLHAVFPLWRAMVADESWCYRLPEDGPGIYLPDPIARVICPSSLVDPSEEYYRVSTAGLRGLKRIPLHEEP